MDNLPQDTGDGRQEGACHSAALALAFDKATWKKLHAGGNPGECHYLLSRDSAGMVYEVEIGIGRSGSLSRPTPTPMPAETPTPGPTDTPTTTTSSSKATSEELAYIAQMSQILNSVGDAETAISSEAHATDLLSNAWKIRVAADLVSIQLSYEETASITPPDAFSGSYNLILQAMTLLNDSTNNFASGVDNSDPSLFQTATDEINQAGALLTQANDQFNQEVAAIAAR
jgi:hypothetical protein